MRSRAGEGVLIIGYGNELRGDDGAGRCVARLLAAAGFDVIEAEELLPEFAERIAGSRLVVFVDCNVDVAPGKLAFSRVRTVGERPAVEHGQCTPEAVMDIVEMVYRERPEAWAMGIGPLSLEMEEGLSEEVGNAVEEAAELIANLAARQAE